jgi:hypothetical protein
MRAQNNQEQGPIWRKQAFISYIHHQRAGIVNASGLIFIEVKARTSSLLAFFDWSTCSIVAVVF